MLKYISKTVSYLFHPFIMPIVGVLVILTGTYLLFLPIEGKIAILKVVAISTILLPASILPMLYYQKRITSIEISERNERLLPLFISMIFYFVAYYVLMKMGAPKMIQNFLLATFSSLLIATIVHFKWKISLHMIGIGGVIGLLSYINHVFTTPTPIYLVVAILLAGVIGSSRLYLKEHTQGQIYSGFALGFLSTFLIMVLMNNQIYG